MATYTITTPVNIDTLTAKTGGDIYNINGGHLTIDQDSRYGLNQNTSASLANITLSATLGGNLTIDGRFVRIIPFNTGAGLVPASGTTITQGGASGTLIGVWSALNVAPTAAGAAMPTSGFVKIKGWNSVAYAAGALTGISATATGVDRVGWLEIVGDEAAALTVNRLNTATIRGDWFSLGTTTGSNATGYQIPTSGLNVFMGGVWVENDISLSVSSASYSGEYVTINTTVAHGLQTGDRVTITGATPTGYNAEGVTVIVDDTDTFRYYRGPNRNIAAYTSGGTVTDVLDWYPNARNIAATAAAMATDGIRGRVCWIGVDGNVRFQNDGTTSTGGFLPAAGRRVLIGSVLLHNCTTAGRASNAAPNTTTLATRYDFNTTGGGALVMDKVMCAWYGSFTSAYSLDFTNVSFLTQIVTSKVVQALNWTNVCLSNYVASDNAPTANHSVVGMQGGATYTNCHFSRSNWVANCGITNFQDKIDFEYKYCKIIGLVTRNGTNLNTQLLQRCFRGTYTDCILAIDQSAFTTGADITFTNTLYYYEPVGTTLAANPKFSFNTIAIDNFLIDGLWFGELFMVQPVGGILLAGAGDTDQYMRNIGTPTNRLSMGAARRNDQAWSRVTTTATVTSVAHGLKANDTIFVPITSDAGAITAVAKTVLSAPTADTFTFTCLNAGATSGVLSYYPTMAGYLFQISNSSSLNGFYTNRVYVDHLRSGTWTVDNSSINIELTDTICDLKDAPTFNALNMKFKNLGATNAIGALSAIYGTHWFVSLVTDVASTYSATWTRSVSTITVTSTDHKLRPTTPGGITITASSDIAPVVLGGKTVAACPAVNTFVFTGINAGATSGTLTWQPVNARIGLMFNEATPQTVDTYDIISGNPQFTSTGTLAMPTIGDEIIFESYEIRGHSIFTTLRAVMAGGALNDYDIYYDIDRLDGNGYSGTWKNLDYKRAGTNVSSSMTSFTVTDATGINIGDYVEGTAIPPLAKVTNVDLATDTITIDKTTTTSTTGAVSSYFNLPNETVPNTGFKMKWRFVTRTTNTNGISSFYVGCADTSADRLIQYPITEAPYSYELTNVVTGTEAILFDSTDTELDREVLSGSTYTYNYNWNSDDGDSTGNYILLWKDDQVAQIISGITLGAANQSVPVSQQSDLVYSTPATNATVDFGNSRIQMNDTSELSIPELYTYWKDQIRLTNNAQYVFAFSPVGGNTISGATSIPDYIFLASTWTIRPFNSSYTLNVTEGTIVKDGGGDPFENTASPQTVRINYQQPVQAITVSTGGGGGATASEVWSYSTRQLTGIGSSGIASEANATTNKNAIQTDITNLNDLSSADVTAALNTYDAPTKAELDAAQASIEADIAGISVSVPSMLNTETGDVIIPL
jgi:hypothetical protein